MKSQQQPRFSHSCCVFAEQLLRSPSGLQAWVFMAPSTTGEKRPLTVSKKREKQTRMGENIPQRTLQRKNGSLFFVSKKRQERTKRKPFGASN